MKRTSAFAASLALLIGVAGCGPAETVPGSANTGRASANAQANAEHNNADTEFAMRMSSHHRRTIEMAEVLREKTGVSSDVRALASKIVAVHEPEIAQLEGMLRTWGEFGGDSGSQRSAAPEAGAVGGVSEEAADQLAATDGEAAGQLFLDLMIIHHESSIAVAEEEIAAGSNAEALALAETIITTQRMEMERMRALQD